MLFRKSIVSLIIILSFPFSTFAYTPATALLENIKIQLQALSRLVQVRTQLGQLITSGTLDQTGLVGYWSFDETSGTVANDSSGNNNTGTLMNGALPTSGKVGGAISLDGVDDYVSIPHSPALNFGGNRFTVSAWMYTRDINRTRMFGKYGSNGNGFSLGNSLSGGLSLDRSNSDTHSNFGISANRWIHVAAVQESQSVKLYVDGVNVTAYGPGILNVDNTAPLTVGLVMDKYFNGLVDELRVYNRALSASEISQLLSAGGTEPLPPIPTPLPAPIQQPTTPTPVAGVCGFAQNATTAAAPTTNLCSSGTASSVTSNSNQSITTGAYSWMCNGINNGASVSCSANRSVVTVPPAPIPVSIPTGQLPTWVPAPGQTANINLNNLSAFNPCPANNCWYSGATKQQAPWRNWTGAALSRDYSPYGAQIFWGGGHGGGDDVGLYLFDFTTRLWSRVGPSNPRTDYTSQIDLTWYDYLFEGNYIVPGLHTYNYPWAVPANVSGSGSKGSWLIPQLVGSAGSGAKPHAVDLATGQWTRFFAGAPGNAGQSPYAGAFEDTRRGKLWWASMDSSTFNMLDWNEPHPRTIRISRVQPNGSIFAFGGYYARHVYVAEADMAVGFWSLYMQTGVRGQIFDMSSGEPVQINASGPWPEMNLRGAGFGVDWSSANQAFYFYEGSGSTRVLKLKPSSLNFRTATWTWSEETFNNPAWQSGVTYTQGGQPFTRWRYVPALQSFAWSDGPNTSGAGTDGQARDGLMQLWRPNSSGTINLVTPAPVVSFIVNPNTLTLGQSAVLSWSSTNANTCTASGGWTGSKGTTGQQTTTPVANSSYTLTCSGAGGNTAQTVTLQIATAGATSSVPNLTLTAAPAAIQLGQSTIISWSGTNLSSCTALGSWSGVKSVAGGTETFAPSVSAIYTINCTANNGSTLTRSAMVTVSEITPPPSSSGVTTVSLTSPLTGIWPFSVGQAFKEGDVGTGRFLAASEITPLQVNIKNRWPDGSVKFAVISGQVSLTANIPKNVTFTRTTTAPLGTNVATSILQTNGIVAAVAYSPYGTVTWSGNDWNNPQVTLLEGPVMSSWTYRKQIGSDSHLVAWLEVRAYQNGAVEIVPWIENGYLLVSNPGSRAGTASFSLGGTERYTGSLTLYNHQRTYLGNGTTLSHWSGSDPQIIPKHDTAYLMSTKLVPNYGVTTPANSTLFSRLPPSFTPLAQGSYPGNMGTAGYHPSIGLLPEWDAAFLTTNADSRAYRAVLINAYLAGRYGTHFRDETTQRPIRFSSYPNLVLDGTSGVIGTGASTRNQMTSAATGGSGPAYQSSHHPSMGYLAYLLTGRQYFLEETQFLASVHFLKNTDWTRQFTKGLILTNAGANTTRGAAWALRTLAQATAITPDNDPLRTEFVNSLNENIEYLTNRYITRPHNQQGFVTPYSNYNGSGSPYSSAIWMDDFFTAVHGYMQDLKVHSATYEQKLADFTTWKYRSVIGRLGGSGPDQYSYRYAGQYTMNYAPLNTSDWSSGTGPWYSSWGEIARAMNLGTSGEIGERLETGYPDSASGYVANMLPAFAYAVEDGAPGAAQAWTRFTAAANYLNLRNSFANDPVWSVSPRLVGTPVPVPEPTPIPVVPPIEAIPPNVSIMTPSGNVSGNSVIFAAEAADVSGVAGVQFRLNDVDLGPEDTSYPYSITWDSTGSTNGTYVLTARASDIYGNSALSLPVSYVVNNSTPKEDNEPPHVTIVTPQAGAKITGGAVALSVDATDNIGVAGVRFFLDEEIFAEEDTTLPYGLLIDARRLTQGTHTLTVQASDLQGNLSTLASVLVIVENTSIIVDVTAPSTPGRLSSNVRSATEIDLAWTQSSDAVGVTGYLVERCAGKVCNNFTQIGISTADAYRDSVRPASQYSYRVRATDAAKNLSKYSYIVSVETPAKAKSSGGGGAKKTTKKIVKATAWLTPQVAILSRTTTTLNKPASFSPGNGGSSSLTNPSSVTANFNFAESLFVGSRGAQVLALQQYLASLGYLTSDNVTGFYGVQTSKAVERYQCARGILCGGSAEATGYGLVGTKTRAVLNVEANKVTNVYSVPKTVVNPAVKLPSVTLTKTLYKGITDNEVVLLKKFLVKNGYLVDTEFTNRFGGETEAALKRFQCEKGIVCSGTAEATGYGVTGPKTRAGMR